MYALVIILIATTLQHPSPHQVLRVSLPYDTQYTCNEAEHRLDGPFISAVYAATHKKQTVKRVEMECVRSVIVDPSRPCPWSCSNNAIHITSKGTISRNG